jgi:hypothetical protein
MLKKYTSQIQRGEAQTVFEVPHRRAGVKWVVLGVLVFEIVGSGVDKAFHLRIGMHYVVLQFILKKYLKDLFFVSFVRENHPRKAFLFDCVGTLKMLQMLMFFLNYLSSVSKMGDSLFLRLSCSPHLADSLLRSAIEVEDRERNDLMAADFLSLRNETGEKWRQIVFIGSLRRKHRERVGDSGTVRRVP